MNKIQPWYAFVGPTFPGFSYPGLHVLPPAKRGDILKLLEKSPEGILLVDGFFGQQASVMHRELLEALRLGLPVVGCSSMGALRAAELHEQGMIGVGKIFESFRSGHLTGDDEVAMLHGPSDLQYCEVTFPLCNLRSTVEVVSKTYIELREEFSTALRVAAQMPYFARTLSQVDLQMQRLGAIDNNLIVIDLLRRHWVNQKRLDLEEALPKLFDGSILSNALTSRTALPETSWLRFYKQNTKNSLLKPARSLIRAIVQFYEPSFENHLLSAFKAATLRRLENSKTDLYANGVEVSISRLNDYLSAWPASDEDGAIGAALHLQPNSTYEDWMQSPPKPVPRYVRLDWARREFSVVDSGHRSFALSPNYQSVLTCAHFIERFNRELPESQSAWTNTELWKTLRGHRLWLTNPSTAASQFLFDDSVEMLTEYKHLAAFEAALLYEGQTPWWGVDTRNLNCIPDLVSTLRAMKNE